MQISHKNKWIYVAINKSGSTSMGHHLKEYADESFTRQKSDAGLGHHSKIRQAKDYIEGRGLDFNEYFKFTLARNPWSREYSIYKYRRLKYEEAKKRNTFHQLRQKRQNRLILCANHSSFKSYFLEKANNNNKSDSIKGILTIRGELAVDYIAKIENLSDSILFLSQKIKISAESLPLLNKRKQSRQKLCKIYDDEMISASLKLFEWEIKNLDYNFDSYADIIC